MVAAHWVSTKNPALTRGVRLQIKLLTALRVLRASAVKYAYRSAACAAASRAIGTRKGEQET
jgi:hypothetical protein